MIEILSDNWRYLLIGNFPDGPVKGLALTFFIAVVALLLTFPAAILIALARTSGVRWLAWLATGFVYIIRGLPLLLLVFWTYFMLPLVIGRPIDPVATLTAAIVVYQTAYLSEVIRGGIEGLPKGQLEAAQCLGMNYVSIQGRIILPQALYNVMPGMLNQFTAIVKETSLGSIISVSEVTHLAQQINNATVTKSFQVFTILAALYFVLCYSLSLASEALEQRISRKRSGALRTPDPKAVLQMDVPLDAASASPGRAHP